MRERPTSRTLSKLRGFYRGLEALYETRTGIDPHELVLPFEAEDQPREVLMFRECDDGFLEISLALDRSILERLESTPVEVVLGDEGLGHTLPVIEGLSHLVYLVEAARQNRPVSGLELETQAEVDKLAICLLHHWPHADRHFERLVDRLYHGFELAPLSDDLRERYDVANRVALGFSRHLRPHVDAGRLAKLRQELRKFWRASMTDKQALARAA